MSAKKDGQDELKKKHVEVRRSRNCIDFAEFVEAFSEPGEIVFRKTVRRSRLGHKGKEGER
jgi:hypothetical protein